MQNPLICSQQGSEEDWGGGDIQVSSPEEDSAMRTQLWHSPSGWPVMGLQMPASLKEDTLKGHSYCPF
jgi:hypothetical protein